MKTKAGISGSMLKWIAVLLMAVDHVGAGIVAVRYIGRPSFPIFCFLLVQGFVHTHNVKKYALRLFLFALVSEIPFDLALHIKVFHWQNQNVFFTLFIGLLVICFIQARQNALWAKLAGLLAGAVLADALHTDYGAFGVALIVLLYLLRNRKPAQCILGAVCCAWELTAPLAFVPIWFYNGERGRQPRWFFYWFYPVHLLLYSFIGLYVLPALIL